MNKTQKKELYKKAWKKWGMGAQLGCLMEECAEAIQAANKLLRGKQGSWEFLAEEMADVEIMFEQFKQSVDWIEEYVEEKKAEKLERLAKILGDDEEC